VAPVSRCSATDPDPIAFIFGFSDRNHVVAAAAAAPAAMAILNLSVGMMASGKFLPPPNSVNVYVTNQNPDANLVKAGFTSGGALKPGRYYLVGFTPFQGHSLVWHMPVDLHAGSNAVTLTPQNGSVSH